MNINKSDLKQISDYIWEIPQSFRSDMRVPARVYADDRLIDQLFKDRTLDQLVNVATLPGIVKAAMAMPDAHEGYGFPIGGVAATRHPDGAISPGGIGYDINCGVRLIISELKYSELRDKIAKLAHSINREVPTGVGRGGAVKLNRGDLNKVLKDGSRWAVENGYGEKQDLDYTESGGSLETADPGAVSEHAARRGSGQLGSLGAGNHFIEIDRIVRIYDEKIAEKFGLFKDQAAVMIHTGSRGLGHQVATDYIRIMMRAIPDYGISVPDRELVCVPFNSKEGMAYARAMAASANFAWANRQLIMNSVRRAWRRELGDSGGKLSLLYDVAHNIAKIEEHDVNGVKIKVIMHRKGATRAFGPGENELPLRYRDVGQPVIIPGSMGTASYVLAGTKKAMSETFGSTCHGAGRAMSRMGAKKTLSGEAVKKELCDKNIVIEAGSVKGLIEEAPQAYKDVHNVVDVVHGAGIAAKVARLKPLAVIKG